MNERWIKVENSTINKSVFGVVLLEYKLILIGGQNDGKSLNTVSKNYN